MPPETSMFHIIKPSSIPEPTVATTSGATFLSSLSLIRAGSIDGVSINGHIKNDQLKEIEMEFVEADQTAAKSEKVELPKLVKKEDVTDDLTSYYRSIVDIQLSSRNLHALAYKISRDKDLQRNPENPDQTVVSKVFNKVKSIWTTIKTMVGHVIDRLRGIAESLGNSINKLLDGIVDAMKKGSQAIIDAFMDLSNYFLSFMATLTEQMFKFLTIIGSIPDSQGYAIENIQVKLPSLKFEYVNMFQVSVPLPNVDPPEMTLNLRPKGRTS